MDARRLLSRSRLVLSLTLVGAAIAQPARADEAEQARSRQAQTLFDRGRDLMDAGNFALACGLLAESQHLDPGGGTLLNLAVCHERQGRLATAWAEYHDALSVAVRDGRADRQGLATERIQSVATRLPHLLVTLPAGAGAPAGIVVAVDGSALSPLALGAPLPVDPGVHEVSATAPGYAPWSVQLPKVDEAQDLDVPVPYLRDLRPLPATPSPRRTRLSTPSYVAGGVALSAFATMAVTGAVALAAQSSADRECAGSFHYCSASGPSDASRARAFAWASTVSLGIALVASGIAAFWPRVAGDPKAANLTPGPSPGPSGVALRF